MANKRRRRRVITADTVQWIGLCPCGCGAYKAVLLDENERPIATFGWDREGWSDFTAGVFRMIDGEPNGAACPHHTAH